jgi:DNA-binding LacI/PurR family transcriptional regulator
MKPAYQHLRDRILEDFWKRQSIQVGFKLPTERELEKRYQVSRPTISKAIAALAAEGWVTKRQGSGIYVAAVAPPAKSDDGKARPRIGFVTQSLQAVLCHRVFEGVESVARKQGYGVEVASTNWDYAAERSQMEAMRQRGVHGVVLYPVAARAPDREYLAHEFRDYPIVVVDLYQPTMKRPHFIFDNYQAGREMTEHLLEQGRREIAFLKFPDAIPYRSVDDRVAGYRRALEDAGVPFVPERVITFEGTGPLTKDHSKAMEQFLTLKPRPTALITPQDPYAHGSIAWLQRKGVAAPEDVVVVGFDDLQNEPWSERFPTTQPDFVRMGERATEMLIERISSRNFEPTEVVLPCPLALPSEDKAGRMEANQVERSMT